MNLSQQIQQHLNELPAALQAEVLEFVLYLTNKKQCRTVQEPKAEWQKGADTLMPPPPANNVRISIVLPDALASEAQASGLLSPESLEVILREELRRRRVEQLFDSVDRLANVATPPLTESEIEEQIAAARAAERPANARSA